MRFSFKREESLVFLPDFITLLNLFTGFLSIEMVHHDRETVGAWLIVLSLVWDSLDGNIARIFKSPTILGRELDSLADVVSFVVAPAFLVSKFILPHISPWMLLLLFIYLAAGTYRLARFNIRPPVVDFFEGLPTPAAAVTLTMTTLACIDNHWTDLPYFAVLVSALLVILSFLMVSQVPYPKLSAIKFSRWKSFFYLSAIVFILVFTRFREETAFAAIFALFLIMAPLYCMPPKADQKQSQPECR